MFIDVLSNMDMFDLENDLPDELMSSSTWGLGNDHMAGNKPPAQGPGPGGIQNGVDGPDGSQLRQMHLNHHLMQQQVSNLL